MAVGFGLWCLTPLSTIFQLYTSTIRRFRIEVVNVEILQHVFVVRHLCCNRCSICLRDYRNSVIFTIGRNFIFYWFLIEDVG